MALPAGVEISGGHVIDQDEVPVVRLDGQVSGSTNPLLVESASVSKGDETITSAGLQTPTVPTGATKAVVKPTGSIRIRDTGGDPSATVGIRVGTEGWIYDGDKLSTLKLWVVSGEVDIWYYA